MTSIRRRKVFRLDPEPEKIISSTKSRKPSRKKKPSVRPKPKTHAKLQNFKKSSDKHSFAHLAKILTSGERLKMLNAVDRLKGRSRILVELACFSSFQFVRLASISNLARDVDALIDIAKYCQFADTRAAAVDELSSNNEALVDIANSSLFKDTRADAISFIKNPDSLAEVASKAPKKDSRIAALKLITGHSRALKKVAKESSRRSMRIAAVKHLKDDMKALVALLKATPHLDVKKVAASLLFGYVDSIDDIDTLIEIAMYSTNEDSRYIAIGRLSRHPEALKKIIYNSRHRDARSTALMLLSDAVSELDNPDLLVEIAVMSPYEDCRVAALERLVDMSSALQAVATKSKYGDARNKALDMLKNDVESLKSISKLSRYSSTRKKAHKLVSHPDVFEKELSRILG